MFGKPYSNRLSLHFLFAAIIVLSFHQIADAHLVSTGAGPFYDGSAHFFLTYEEILPVIALSLFAGLRGTRNGRWLIAVLPLAWIAGGLAGLCFPKLALPSALNTVLLLLMPGLLLAFDWNLPFKAVLTITSLLIFLLGFSNGIAFSEDTGVLGVLGSAAAALIIAVFGASLAIVLSSGWTRIAIRVAGSWLTALGLLALGWSLRN